MFHECRGIEILFNLFSICSAVEKKWKHQLRYQAGAEAAQETKYRFEYDDATLVDWSKSDLVFINSTCFDDPLMEKIGEKVKALENPLAIVLTTTRRLPPSSGFRLLEKRQMHQNWGTATIYIQQRACTSL